jgi:hypothetical protein
MRRMPSERTIRRQLTNTYHSRAIASQDEIKGRFAREEASSVIGAGAAYLAARHPFSDDLNVVLNAAPDTTGYDTRTVDGSPFKFTGGNRDARAELAAILSRLTEEELKHEIAKASFEQRSIDPADPMVQEFQDRIDVCGAELRRRIDVASKESQRGDRGSNRSLRT